MGAQDAKVNTVQHVCIFPQDFTSRMSDSSVSSDMKTQGDDRTPGDQACLHGDPTRIYIDPPPLYFEPQVSAHILLNLTQSGYQTLHTRSFMFVIYRFCRWGGEYWIPTGFLEGHTVARGVKSSLSPTYGV